MDSTLAKGLAVLEWLVRAPRASSVSEVAGAFGIARSNAHRTLQTLVACGWACQDDSRAAYRASLKLFELGSQLEAALDLRPLLRPHLATLAQACGETIHLTVLDGADVIYLDKFDSPLPVAAYSRIGGRAPAACVASGKALLAALNVDLAALRQRLPELHAHTPHSHTDWMALHADLQRTRARGVAQNREEWRLGVCGLGAPVFDARGLPVAAIGMSVPSIRFGRAQVQTLSQALLAAAQAASLSLGWRMQPSERTSAGPAARPSAPGLPKPPTTQPITQPTTQPTKHSTTPSAKRPTHPSIHPPKLSARAALTGTRPASPRRRTAP